MEEYSMVGGNDCKAMRDKLGNRRLLGSFARQPLERRQKNSDVGYFILQN
ncbi:MAG: hypothetical protein ACLU4J_00185 [Butyricimonas paravirosa]